VRIIVKIKWLWNKKKLWKNKKYALVSIFKMKRCYGNGFTSLYRNNHGTWGKIMEFNQVSSTTISTHLK